MTYTPPTPAAGPPGPRRDRHAANTHKNIRLPAADGAALIAWFTDHWRELGYDSVNAALVDAWRKTAREYGWRPPAAPPAAADPEPVGHATPYAARSTRPRNYGGRA
jgi:hypothetical protein